MKNVLKFYPALVLALSSYAQTTTVNVGTGISNRFSHCGNNVSVYNVITAVSPAWHAPVGPSLWVSFIGDSKAANIQNGTIVNFWCVVYLGQNPTGTINVMADDAGVILVNGFPIQTSLRFPLGANCSTDLPNCTKVDRIDITQHLNPGENTIDVLVEQAATGTYFGLDLFGVFTSTSSGN